MYTYLQRMQRLIKVHTIDLFGIIAFLFTFIMGLLALIEHSTDLVEWLPIGLMVFFLNLFYIKLIRISRQDYENSLKEEKEYSQKLLKNQKRFLRSAVHETNTPLAVIMANIELYEQEYGKNQTLSNIEAATKNIYGIYDDLSYLTKKDKIEFNRQEIALASFIQSRIDFFDIVALQSSVKMLFKGRDNPVTITINETKLQRIVDNNITNAIKYTKEAQVIEIKLYNHHDSTVFEISSTSTIIKNPDRLFDAYYRENDVKEGLGLGLNLVARICKEEDIKIELTSTEEKTTFKYHFKREHV